MERFVSPGGSNNVSMGFYILHLDLFPFMLISTWRSAGRYQGPRVWSILAKVAVYSGWVGYIKGLFELLEKIVQAGRS
jgi:hypothetical protein